MKQEIRIINYYIRLSLYFDTFVDYLRKRMVTVLLSGGLGNQMFQYAAAKALAVRLNTPLAIDLYALNRKSKTVTPRSFELDIFSIDVPIKNTLQGEFLIKALPFVQSHRQLFQKLGLFTDTYAILYQPAFETLKGNITLSGYFQNEKYFWNIADELREDFIFKYPLKDRNKAIANEIISGESVSIHIRRGDYVSNKSSVNNFVTCDNSYYDQAITLIKKRIKKPTFYVFSDDIDWVKNNLDFTDSSVRYIDWNKGKNSYMDMQLMSLCKHNIIANSSFSWWGAWLNNNPDKTVIAPAQWFRDEKKNMLLDDFLPKGWIKL